MTGRAFSLVDPFPRSKDMIFTEESLRRLEAIADLHGYFGEGRMPDDEVDDHLPKADILVGQTPLD